MKKNLKLGLAVSLAYTALAFAPSLTGVAGARHLFPHQSRRDVKVVTPEQTIEKTETNYNKKLFEYTFDHRLASDEIKNLHTMQREILDLLDTEKMTLEAKYNRKRYAKTEELNKEINKYKQKLENKETKSDKSLNDLRKKLEETISEHYPALINEDKWPVTYSAETTLKPGLITTFRGIVAETDKIIKKYYKDNSLESLSKAKQYTINDILILYNSITKEREKTNFEKQEAELKKKIAALERERYEIESSPQILVLKNKIKKYDVKMKRRLEITRHFEDYSTLEKEIQEFEERYGNFNKEFAISSLKEEMLKKEGLERIYTNVNSDSPLLLGHEKRFKTDQDNAISGLEFYLQSEGFEADIEPLRNPAKTRLPWWLAQIVLGLSIPLARNLLIKGYVRGSKARGPEYVMSGAGGLFNGIAGAMIIDGLHPLAYPARMIITPLIFQPIFSIAKWYPFQEL